MSKGEKKFKNNKNKIKTKHHTHWKITESPKSHSSSGSPPCQEVPHRRTDVIAETGNTIYILHKLHLPWKCAQINLTKYHVELLFITIFINSYINISRF